ncbi:hypothetical protein CVM39_04065 [Pseudooceanicola antarcticus]|uniref:Uncharacterized protein n=1 Tax=Pseudooceanicola antarcticus TaxID=1247613 RepID=A0ABX4MTN8_9RHOB|nr:hypothetical protein CVM39_04065 [Pseudooceanicola antarcticus]
MYFDGQCPEARIFNGHFVNLSQFGFPRNDQILKEICQFLTPSMSVIFFILAIKHSVERFQKKVCVLSLNPSLTLALLPFHCHRRTLPRTEH